MADYNRSEEYTASQDNEGASMGKKYGGLVPKKKPLISKDHERAFFDSADWALCKQQGAGMNQKSTVAIETLQPKLQRTPHQQLPPRRPACTSGRDSLAE
uniref:Putative CAMP-regulated phosphoprotein 19-related protein isoform 1 n=1 Tax=Davidia involucrata TaxID=16924 RepID=A0A5B7ATZ0_DAVIN